MYIANRFTSLDDFRTGFGGSFPAATKYSTSYMFRGQRVLDWNLQSTLEQRNPKIPYSLQQYLEICSNAYASLTAKFPSGRTFPNDALEAKNWYDLVKMGAQPFNEILYIILELRHYGFPSPVLDWTSSEDVAAFFAYESSDGTNDVIIFAYRKNGLHSTFESEPSIRVIRPHIGPLFRQSKQRAIHTICGTDTDDKLVFCPYESVLLDQTNSKDEVLKFSLCGAHKDDVILQLRSAGITRETIYGNEDHGLSDKDQFCKDIADELFH